MSIQHKFIGFSTSLDEDDYGIIISKEGIIKGVWIPQGKDLELIPPAVVDVCVQNFGIDPHKDRYTSRTIH